MNWTKFSKLQREHIYQTRNEVLLAVQLFCNPPLVSLPNIVIDPNHKLTWNSKTKSIDTLLFGGRHNVQMSLKISDFKMNVLVEEIVFDSITLYKKSVGDICGWISDSLVKLGVAGSFFEDHVDAVLGELDFTADERFDFYRKEDFLELESYFQNADFILNKVKSNMNLKRLSFYISSSDLSLAGTYAAHADHEASLGFSPGDSDFPEPYFFVKLESGSVAETVGNQFIPVGQWNDGVWKGFYLTASDFIKEQAYLEEHITFDFLKGAVEIVVKA